MQLHLGQLQLYVGGNAFISGKIHLYLWGGKRFLKGQIQSYLGQTMQSQEYWTRPSPEICRIYVSDTCQICPRYAPDISQVCLLPREWWHDLARVTLVSAQHD